jgi:acetylornithine/N-succinyldiaminopimelate aminotransferase
VPFGDIDAVRSAIGEETAGFLIEPVQGEGGARATPAGFLKALRALADEHGLLLVLDEVQCGMGRTGRLFAHEWDGITPDIMAVAKAIGGGFPLGACLATREAASGMTAGTHGSTYGGNPLAMAVGNAVLDVMLEPGFLDRVNAAARMLRQKLAAVQDAAPGVIEEVRGQGLLIGLKLRVPNIDFVKALNAKGLLTVGAGDNVVRLLPPLVVSDEDIAEAVDKIAEAAAELAPAPGAASGS